MVVHKLSRYGVTQSQFIKTQKVTLMEAKATHNAFWSTLPLLINYYNSKRSTDEHN